MNLSNPTDRIPKSSKILIAVCMSGHAGCWRTAVQNIKWFFEYRHLHPIHNLTIEIHYFIHTLNTETDKADIEIEFKPKIIENEEYDNGKFLTEEEAMFYSLEKCLSFKREYELTNSIQYDVVVKSQLDTVYNPSMRFPLDRVLPKFCYTSNISTYPKDFNYFNFDNTIFYGDSATMDLVGDIYNLYLLHRNNPAEETTLDADRLLYYSPGCLLYAHIVDSGIHPECKKNIEYAIVKETAVQEKLSGIQDYAEIKQLWKKI